LTYLSWIASEDTETQKNGFVVLLFTGDHATKSLSRLLTVEEGQAVHRLQCTCPIRWAAAHVCLPNSPLLQKLGAMLRVACTHDAFVRTRITVGSNVENRYQVAGYGFPVSLIPLTDGGTVKTKQLIQWIQSKTLMEEKLRDESDAKEYIDCPSSNDVVFRIGTASLDHPGNVYFRELIAIHYQQHNTASSSEEKVKVSLKIVQQVTERGGRFLEWDRSIGYWTPMVDRSQIRVKVALTLRDFKKVVKAAMKSQSNSSATSSFTSQDGRKRQRTEARDEDDDDFCNSCFGNV
jgi:hypothetical protein